MQDFFDKVQAEERHRELMNHIQRLRDDITHDVIDYYWRAPETEEEEHKYHEGMRKYLIIASDRIHELLHDGPLA